MNRPAPERLRIADRGDTLRSEKEVSIALPPVASANMIDAQKAAIPWAFVSVHR